MFLIMLYVLDILYLVDVVQSLETSMFYSKNKAFRCLCETEYLPSLVWSSFY